MVPAVIAGVVAAFLMVLLRLMLVDQAYRSINWTTAILAQQWFLGRECSACC